MNPSDKVMGAAMAPQQISVDVLREKYAKSDTAALGDVRRRVSASTRVLSLAARAGG